MLCLVLVPSLCPALGQTHMCRTRGLPGKEAASRRPGPAAKSGPAGGTSNLTLSTMTPLSDVKQYLLHASIHSAVLPFVPRPHTAHCFFSRPEKGQFCLTKRELQSKSRLNTNTFHHFLSLPSGSKTGRPFREGQPTPTLPTPN